MAILNIALSIAGAQYRFPEKVSTFGKKSQFDARSCSGLSAFVVCDGCNQVYTPSTGVQFCQGCKNDLYKIPRSLSPVPKKVYMYNSVTKTLELFFGRKHFVDSLMKWTYRSSDLNVLSDVYDGAVWKTFKTNPADSVPFVDESPYNLMMALNVDWFQPYKGTQHSTGAIYLTIQNLPREERNLKKNVLLVGLIPGPTEPSTSSMNHFLEPLVRELLVLMNGVRMHTYSHGVVQVKAALSLVSCDMPAAKKVCGFTAANSTYACHKCNMAFPALPSNQYKRDFRNFDVARWTTRTKEENRYLAEEWYHGDSSKRMFIESTSGTRWTALHRLPYFDPVRFTVVDPMHNLYLGTCKRMANIWREKKTSNDEPMLTNRDLREMKADGKKMLLPLGYDATTLLEKLDKGAGFSQFTADDWRIWCVALSPVLLFGRLPSSKFRHWMLFVNANRMLAKPTITLDDAEKAHVLLHRFCSEMTMHYGDESVVPNMHFHMHIKAGIEDYGPIYGYWLFNFERYNGNIKQIRSNRKTGVECTFARGFLRAVHLDDYLESVYGPGESEVGDVLKKFVDGKKTAGVADEELTEISRQYYEQSSFLSMATSTVPFGYEPLPMATVSKLKKPTFRTRISDQHYLHLLQYYQQTYGNYFCSHDDFPTTSQSLVSNEIEKINSISILNQKYNCVNGRSERGSYIRAVPIINDNRNQLVPAEVQYFFQHKVLVRSSNGSSRWLIHTFAFVRWFKQYSQIFPSYEERGLEVWRNEFEEDGYYSILPVHRIHSAVGVMEWLPLENLNVVIPIERKIVA